MATNPLVSMPNANKVKTALEKCELVIVSDCVRSTDTAKVADVLLPVLTWGENDGTVTNSDRHISRRRPFLSKPHQARADWDIITEVAHRMGFGEHFPYHNVIDIFREHAALSDFENEGDNKRLFNIGALKNISDQEYNHFAIRQWPITNDHPQGMKRLFADRKFSTVDNKANFISVIPKAPRFETNKEFPLFLNTGRLRDQWHTMTRTGGSASLSSHSYEPCVEINPLDGVQFGLKDEALARINSPLKTSILVRIKYTDKQSRGSVFVPIHWNNQYSGQAKVSDLIPSVVDPISGQPESKHAIINIEPCQFLWYGFVLSSTPEKVKLEFADYWVRAKSKGHWRYELAGHQQPNEWSKRVRALLGVDASDESWVEYFDSALNTYRAAQFKGKRLINCVFISSQEELPPRDWLMSLFEKHEITKGERMSLLSALPPADQEDAGRIVCACFGVGEKTIIKTINEKRLSTTQQIGDCLQAGTNCGSCLPELRGILQK